MLFSKAVVGAHAYGTALRVPSGSTRSSRPIETHEHTRDFKKFSSNPVAMPTPSAHVKIALATINDKKAAAEPGTYPQGSAQ